MDVRRKTASSFFNVDWPKRARKWSLRFIRLHQSIGRYGDEIDEREVLRSIIANVKPAPGSAGEQTDHYLDALVESRVSGEKIVCRLRTLSEIILEEGIERIDLLKIDVEKRRRRRARRHRR